MRKKVGPIEVLNGHGNLTRVANLLPRSWLETDNDANPTIMYCSLCRKYGKQSIRMISSTGTLRNKGTFISGCTNFRASTVSEHEESKGHLHAVAMEKAKTQPEKTLGYASLLKLHERERESLQLKFRNVHVLTSVSQSVF